MLYRDPERFGRLSRKCASALIHNGPGDHHWPLAARFSWLFVNSRDRGLAIQSIKYWLDKQDIDTAIHQSADLLCISPGQGIKRSRPESGIFYIRRERKGFICRTDCTGYKARFGRIQSRIVIRRLPGHPGCGHVELVGEILQVVIFLRNRVGIKSIGLNNICTRFQELQMDIFYDLWLSNTQQIVISLEAFFQIHESITPEQLLSEGVALNHGAHRTVQNKNSFLYLSEYQQFFVLHIFKKKSLHSCRMVSNCTGYNGESRHYSCHFRIRLYIMISITRF